jgi:chemotaxis protein methyltransferase CheR
MNVMAKKCRRECSKNYRDLPVPLDATDFEYIRSLVLKRSAIVLEPEKNYLVESRLLPLARREGFSSIAELVARLRASSLDGLQQKVVEAMTTNETSFFRDQNPFEALRKVVLPDLFQRRASERKLRIWCGACSTGQEPYTIAMILCEHFVGFADWKTEIIATDLSTDVLARAREGRFSQLEVNRGLPAAWLAKYFQRHGTGWQLAEKLRRLVDFCPLNLIDPAWRIAPADIVFLRNVLIYFDVPTKKTILQKVRQVLRPDGYLFLGGAETTMNLDDAFERIPFERAGCYRLRKT